MSEKNDNLKGNLTSYIEGTDLVIESFIPTATGEGEQQVLALTFSIRNDGYTAAAPFQACLYIDNTVLGYVQVDAIGGVAVSPVYTYTLQSLTPGDHTLKVTANDPISITEVNTINNSKVCYVRDTINKSKKTDILRFNLSDRIATVKSPAANFKTYNLTQKYSTWTCESQDGSVQTGGVVQQQCDADDYKVVRADQDQCTDLIFAKANGTWMAGYCAKHMGGGNWAGTGERVSVNGRNRIYDLYIGSLADPSILYLTDDACGDALFLEDVFTELPSSVLQQRSRIARINTIYAGAGDDVVDLTSQQFLFSANSIEIHGGDGNDNLWANATSATLLGEAGNDRLIGGQANDILSGGSGNDSMHLSQDRTVSQSSVCFS